MKLLSLLATLGLAAGSLPAANIAWISFHPADNTPNANAAGVGFTNAPDVGYTALLAANGHTVTRFTSQDNLDTALLPDGVTPVIDALNTNDVIMISRSTPSGHYQHFGEVVAWHNLTKPVVVMGGFTTRGGTAGGSRLGLTTGEATIDVNMDTLRLRVNAPAHPIFNGIALNSTNLMVNGYARRVAATNNNTGVITNQIGISINNNPIAIGGSALAVAGTPGVAGLNGMIIGEIPAGVVVSNQASVNAAAVGYTLAAKRVVFLTGSRESGIVSDAAGIFDLLPDGSTLLLNTVTYLTTPQIPKATLPILGATNLVPTDTWTFSPGVIGDTPLTFQWYRNGTLVSGATDGTLSFASFNPTVDAGAYQLFVTNAAGWATSTVASLSFHNFGPTSITNSLIAYWPLDAALGTKTVDLVSGYDMTMVNLTSADIVPGRWDNAVQFNGSNSILQRINNPGDALPIYYHSNFTVSLWVSGISSAAYSDRRVYAEGLTTSTTPMFDLGTHSTGANGSVDIFIRPDSGAASPDHARTVGTAYDGNWHHVVYVQREIGDGNRRAQVWIDGVVDPLVITPARPPITLNTTSIGALLRSSVSAWFNGYIDEVAVWNRVLSGDEIAILQTTQITNPPTRLQPLTISSFKADLPSVVTGGSTTLRWDVSKDANQVTITPFGDVTGQTLVGVGARVITPAANATYVLTVTRGVDTLSATTSVAVVSGVTPGWTVLDTFDQAQPGNLFASGYWNDTSGNGGQVVTVNGNKALRPTSAGVSFLNLRELSVTETQAVTLFFRMIAGTNTPATVTNIVGLTDKSQRNYGDSFTNVGSVVYATPFTNNVDFTIETNAWYLGARNFPGTAPVDFHGFVPGQSILEPGVVYNVWVDITNTPMADFMSDTFSVYVQKEGGAPRIALFENYTSDRDFNHVDPVLGGMLPTLDKLIVMGNHATISSIFDDFYLSTGGYNATVPKPYTIVASQPPGPVTIVIVGNQLQITWTNGTLQSSTTVDGQYTDVPGNPTSPYLVAPAGTATFYRVRGNP